MQKERVAELEVLLLSELDVKARIKALLALNEALGSSDFLRALMVCQEALQLAESADDKVLLAGALRKLGDVQWKSGDNESAQGSYARCLVIYDELGDFDGLSNSYCGLGIVHGTLKDSANALDFFEKGAAAAKRAGNDVMLAHNLGNIGHIYANIEDYITALKYFAKALGIDRELGDEGKQGVSNMLGAIAGVMVFQGEYEGAIEKLEESLKIDEELGNRRGTAVTLMNLGITYRKAGKFAEAISYFNRALAFAEKIHFGSVLPQMHEQIAETYEAIGDREEAMYHIRKYNEFQVVEKRLNIQRKLQEIKASKSISGSED
jgi:tetratricopeptide (TPR) repeat protein